VCEGHEESGTGGRTGAGDPLAAMAGAAVRRHSGLSRLGGHGGERSSYESRAGEQCGNSHFTPNELSVKKRVGRRAKGRGGTE
jgi:hypothetical protein